MDASSIARGVSLSCTALGSTNAGLGGVPVSVVIPPPDGGGGSPGPATGKIQTDLTTGIIEDELAAGPTQGVINVNTGT
jgi:hypothetical protein